MGLPAIDFHSAVDTEQLNTLFATNTVNVIDKIHAQKNQIVSQ